MEDLPLYARLSRAAAAAPRPKKRAASVDAGSSAAAPPKKSRGSSKGSSSAAAVGVPASEGPGTVAAAGPSLASAPQSPERRDPSTPGGDVGAEPLDFEPSIPQPEQPSSSRLPPPPPLPKPLLTRGRLWQDGVVPEVSTAFLPPAHFSGCGALSQPALDELHRNQVELCRAVGYNQTLIMVREQYARSHADVLRLKAQAEVLAQKLSEAEASAASVGDLKEELEVAEAKAASAVAALERVQGELAVTRAERDSAKAAAVRADQDLQRARADADVFAEEHARAQKEAADSAAALKSLRQERNSLMGKNAGLEKALEAEQAGRQEATDALVEAAAECFKQALAQIRYFNPDVELNLAGYDHRAFVKDDGTLIPYVPAEDALAENDEADASPSNPAAAGDLPSA